MNKKMNETSQFSITRLYITLQVIFVMFKLRNPLKLGLFSMEKALKIFFYIIVNKLKKEGVTEVFNWSLHRNSQGDVSGV